uniref:Uncharacterized protein n=1 Tax=Spongospora subterranea TaxID=70186 RepID=A0A0H5QVD0_9EUKA|eukprot:CRZ05855.1 hypothetical protein [Spongospora subterranea]
MPAVSETIFDLIPSPDPIPSRPDRYICRMPWNTPPTSSTIGIASSTQIPITNLSGSLSPPPSAHQYRHERALFGRSSSCRPEPADYLRKSVRSLPVPRKDHIDRHRCSTKPSLPHHNQSPIIGLTTDKNFIKVDQHFFSQFRSFRCFLFFSPLNLFGFFCFSPR